MEKAREFSKKIWNVIDKGIIGWSVLLMAVMAVMVIVTVILRYVFNITYVQSEEAIVYLFIATTYFGSVYCVKEKEHIDIPFLRDMASNTMGFVMDIVVFLVNIAVQFGLAYFSYTWIEKTGSSIVSALNLPFYIFYLIFPICFTLMGIYTIRQMETEVVPNYLESLKTVASKRVTNLVTSLIYGGVLIGLAYLYTSIDWASKIEKTVHLVMLQVIAAVFHIMFMICFVLIAIYFVVRVTNIFKKASAHKRGGEQ